ncbi:hypothetical protein KBD59_04940, partial [Candidatus Gracilibacteria bacterium]|nr:hypothetical protein [Candidatus Gracilibacteria bacterium]
MTDKLKNFLGEQEESYVAGYAAETADWFRRGIYDAFAEKIASGLADKPTTKHLDVGFGFGLLLLALRVRLEKAVLMGIDTNEIMAYTAIEYAQEGGYPHTSCLGKRLTIDTKEQRITGVSQNFMHIPGYQVAAGKINFLLDDICDPQVLPAILGGEQLDSMSFTLPGASRANLYSKPFNLPAYIAAQKEDRTRMLYARNAEYSQKLRSSGVEYAACHLKPGGQLFLAERCIIEGSLDDIGDEL